MQGVHEDARLDGFLLGRRIHAGAMGEVCEASREDRDFPILVKVPWAAIADALHELHAQDTIHLDVKPENILMPWKRPRPPSAANPQASSVTARADCSVHVVRRVVSPS